MTQQITVDLAGHINQTVVRGHPADFPVGRRAVFVQENGTMREFPRRVALVREDTGTPLAVVSDRYALVPHDRILCLVEEAIRPLDVGPVPRGIYVDRGGARMRAVFKFPALARPVVGGDDICPCLKLQNTYDGTSRISVHIGAFRFVCTNLAVGGGGVFAGGFMSVHAGEIHIEAVTRDLEGYLAGFEAIVQVYRCWIEQLLDHAAFDTVLEPVAQRHAEAIREAVGKVSHPTVYDAYNAATYHATHRMRSVRTAFALLAHVNRAFQEAFTPGPA